jgi:membrane protein
MEKRQTLRKIISAAKMIYTKNIMDDAAALTYSTLMAIVPILAVAFEIARSLNIEIYLEKWIRSTLRAHPEVANYIFDFVASYLNHYNRGLFILIAIALALYTVITLELQLEQIFNKIWQVGKHDDRKIINSVSYSLAIFIVIPAFAIIAALANILLATFGSYAQDIWLLGWVTKAMLYLAPLFLVWLTFIMLFKLMPSIHISLRHIWGPALIAAIAMQALQFVYINSQILLSSYNAIYGSFASLPLFLLWINLSWSITLVAATFCYENAR